MGTHFSVNTRSMRVKENVKKYVLYAAIVQFKCLINFSFKNKRMYRYPVQLYKRFSNNKCKAPPPFSGHATKKNFLLLPLTN